MKNEINGLLEKEIISQFESLSSLQDGSEEKSKAIDDLAKLYRIRIEEEQSEFERFEKRETREEEAHNKRTQFAEQTKDRYVKVVIATAEIVLPLMFYGVWMRRGFEFEKEGIFTSNVFRGLINHFKPKK